ncbi:MAG: hypothetical protein HYZ04_01715, partial [Rhodospirillales bacterium]|nr:hypothetical protein [Rhodospirillales bacterium]
AVVLGGSRQFLGPILGAVLFVGLEEAARGWTDYHNATLGMLLIAAMFLFPTGLAGAAAAVVARLRPSTGGRQ